MGQNNISGAWGETIAAQYLRKKHYKILDCNYRSRYGEIDVIACNKKHIVFVEVKLRKSDKFAEGREFVDYYKQNRIRMTASLYLSYHDTDLQPRFDVIEIYAADGILTRKPVITHLEDAFE